MLSNYRQLAAFFFAMFLSCQGPWSYYPENPETYQGIWTYAYIISGRPVENICLDKIHPLGEVRMPGFAFYESADIKISGSFNNGKDTSFYLEPKLDYYYANNPNCFVGPGNLRANAGGNYELDMSIVWDSAGTKVTSKFNAKTYIPKKFKIVRAYDLEGNQFDKNTTILYLPPPMDIKASYFVPEYSNDDVGGTLVSMKYGDRVYWGESSIDRIINQFNPEGDSARHARFGNIEQVYSVKNQQFGNSKKSIDSIPIIGMEMPAQGRISLLFYATTPDYFKFDETFIDGRRDSRVKPFYNIQNGAGIFAGMLVDTFTLYMSPKSDDIKLYQNNEAKNAYCRTEDYSSGTMNYILRKECVEFWDAVIKCEIRQGKPEDDSICLVHNSDSWYEFQIEDLKKVLSDNEFITWCEHRNFPVKIYPPCGTAMVRYFNSGKSSPILEREVKKWCEEHKTEPECFS